MKTFYSKDGNAILFDIISNEGEGEYKLAISKKDGRFEQNAQIDLGFKGVKSLSCALNGTTKFMTPNVTTRKISVTIDNVNTTDANLMVFASHTDITFVVSTHGDGSIIVTIPKAGPEIIQLKNAFLEVVWNS